MCWGVKALGSGGRGVEFTVQFRELELEGVLEWTDIGWVGAGWGEVCVEDWERVIGEGERKLSFVVEGRSVLLGSVAVANYAFVVSLSSLSSTRQIQTSCDPTLWDTSPNSLYGIQTFPSGISLLPPTLRFSPLTITTKALSPCSSIGMSKDILAPLTFKWSFLDPIPKGLVDVDANDWADGVLIVVPSEFLENRDAFPMDEPVGIQVRHYFFIFIWMSFFLLFFFHFFFHFFFQATATYTNGDDTITFTAETFLQFLPSPVSVITNPPSLSSVISSTAPLVIDLTNSFTPDGIFTPGEWEWEWEWNCFVPSEGGNGGSDCVYERGEKVQLPGRGEGRFEGGGERGKFEVGVPLYFVVRVRVWERGREGDVVVAEGRWEKLFSVVEGDWEGLEVEESSWVCEGGKIGYLVSLFFFKIFNFIFGLFFSQVRFFSVDKLIEFSEVSSLWANVCVVKIGIGAIEGSIYLFIFL